MRLVVCSHFIVPELGPETKFSYSSRKAVNEYKEAKEVELIPVLLFSCIIGAHLLWILVNTSLWHCFSCKMLVYCSLELRLFQCLLAQSPTCSLLRLKRVHPRALIFCPFLTPFCQSTSKSGKILQTLLHSKSWNYLLSGVEVNVYSSDARNVYVYIFIARVVRSSIS